MDRESGSGEQCGMVRPGARHEFRDAAERGAGPAVRHTRQPGHAPGVDEFGTEGIEDKNDNATAARGRHGAQPKDAARALSMRAPARQRLAPAQRVDGYTDEQKPFGVEGP